MAQIVLVLVNRPGIANGATLIDRGVYEGGEMGLLTVYLAVMGA
jgi:hypothetical protein